MATLTKSKSSTAKTIASEGAGNGAATNGHSANGFDHSLVGAADQGTELQPFGTVVDAHIKLDESERTKSTDIVNGVLANTQILAALYKKHHWLMRGPTFYQLHLLLDKFAAEQYELADVMAERIAKLGGVAIGDPRLTAEKTDIPRPPDGVESVPAMVARLIEAHELTLARVRDAIEKTSDGDDEGTADMLVSQVLRANETAVWYLREHLVATPIVD